MQHLKNRLAQHKLSIKNKTEPTALSKHNIDTGHCFDLENTKILTTENNYKRRLILEMIYIKLNPDSINFKTVVNHLSQIYFNILN